MKKLMLLAAVGAGYVFGARAGRQRYETIKSQFLKVKNNPAVQEKAGQAVDAAKEQAPVVKDKLVGVASAAADKVKPSGGSHQDTTTSTGGSHEDLIDQLNPDSTAHQGQAAYPQGDLP